MSMGRTMQWWDRLLTLTLKFTPPHVSILESTIQNEESMGITVDNDTDAAGGSIAMPSIALTESETDSRERPANCSFETVCSLHATSVSCV